LPLLKENFVATTTGVRLTRAGEALLAKVHLGNGQLEITNFVLGDAVWTVEEIEAGELTALKNVRVTTPVAQITTGTGVDAGRLICAGVIDNTYVTEAFYVREIGLMANDPDLGEILYLIDSVAAEAPTTVVESNAIHQEIPVRMELIAVSRDQVELVLSQSVAYVTAGQLAEVLEGKSDTGHTHTSIINTRTGEPIAFWVGTQAQYEELPVKDENTLYLTT
jgi:hypothetical protein